MNHEQYQADLLDAFLADLQQDPHAQPPTALAPQLAELARKMTTAQQQPASDVRAAKARVWRQLDSYQQIRAVPANSNGHQQLMPQEMEQRMKILYKKRKRNSGRRLPLTMVATVLIVVGLGLAGLLITQFRADEPQLGSSNAEDVPPPIVTASPVPTATPLQALMASSTSVSLAGVPPVSMQGNPTPLQPTAIPPTQGIQIETVSSNPDCDTERAILKVAQTQYVLGDAIPLTGYARADDFGYARVEVQSPMTNFNWLLIDVLEAPIVEESQFLLWQTDGYFASRYSLRLQVFDTNHQLLTTCALALDVTSQ